MWTEAEKKNGSTVAYRDPTVVLVTRICGFCNSMQISFVCVTVCVPVKC